MNFRHLTAIFKARTMEFVRDRESFFWNLLFPLILVFGFAFVFSGEQGSLFKTVLRSPPEGTVLEAPFQVVDSVGSWEADLEKIRLHKLELAVDWESKTLVYNAENPNSRLARELFLARLEPSFETQWRGVEATGQRIRYVDWLVPGVIGMNMMFSTLFGVGFVIVRYRKNGVLKRLKATPVSPLTFLTAQAASRLFIAVLTSVFVFMGAHLFLNFLMRGSWFNLLLHTIVAVFCMTALGLVFASRIRSEELSSGILNLVTLPMILLSGVFYSLEGSPEMLRHASLAFPLTHFNEGARKIMLEGAGFDVMGWHTLVLAALGVIFLLVGSHLFKWE